MAARILAHKLFNCFSSLAFVAGLGREFAVFGVWSCSEACCLAGDRVFPEEGLGSALNALECQTVFCYSGGWFRVEGIRFVVLVFKGVEGVAHQVPVESRVRARVMMVPATI